MNQIEQLKQLLYKYETAGLIESDPIKALSCLSDDVIGFGMGEHGVVSSKKSFQDMMLANIKKDPTASYELAFDDVAVNIITDTSAAICATVIVKKTCDSKTTRSSFSQSLTAVLKGNKWLICALHASSLMSAEDMINQRESIKEQTRALEISEERYLAALGKTSHIIFDYDIESGNIIHFNASKKSMEFATNISDAKENLFTNGTIMDGYMDSFNNAFHTIESGGYQSDCTVKIKLITGKEIWYKISLTGIKDSHGKPVKAVGLIEDITDKKEAEIAYRREEQYRKAILSDTMGCYTINFTKGIIENCQIKDERCSPSQPNEPYDDFISRITRARMGIEERRIYLATFSKISALEAFKKGVNELTLEYNILNPDGSHMWMQTIIRLVVDGATDEVKGFLYVKDIDHKKLEEISLKLKSELDSLTNIYNKGAVQSYITDALNTASGRQTGAFMMIDIDHFKDINDTYGHPFGDRVLMDVSKVLRTSLRKSDIVGRLGGDEFCVFCSGIVIKKQVEDIAHNLCKNICGIFKPQNGKVGITSSIGISLCNGKLKSFDDIYREADSALYTVKKEGRNGYAFFEDKKYQQAQKWPENTEWIHNAEWLLNEMDTAVYVCDKENYNLLYINDKILELFHLTRNQCLGKKCYEVLVNRNSPCDFCSMSHLKMKQSTDRLYYLQAANKLFLMKGQLITWNEKEAHLEIAIDITSEKERYADYLSTLVPAKKGLPQNEF